jgi:hypothetical protein
VKANCSQFGFLKAFVQGSISEIIGIQNIALLIAENPFRDFVLAFGESFFLAPSSEFLQGIHQRVGHINRRILPFFGRLIFPRTILRRIVMNLPLKSKSPH